MLSTTMLVTMFQYNHDTNDRLLALAAQVTPEQWDAPQEAGQRSLHVTLFHYLSTEEAYLHLCRHGQQIWDLRQFGDLPDVTSLRTFNSQIYAAYLPYLERLTDDQLTARVTGLMPSSRVESVMIWHILVHMLFHSAQHRSEVAFRLTQFGHSPGFIDFYGYGSWGEG